MELKNSTACVVGSRKLTKQDIQRIIAVATLMSRLGISGRSGGATGADQTWGKFMFVQHILPYNGFQGLTHKSDFSVAALETAPVELRNKAERIAREHHPFGDSLRGFALQAHTRNVFQALGLDLKHPAILTAYVADETPARKVSGGTATAVSISRSGKIPTFNLRIDSEYEALLKILEDSIEHGNIRNI